MSLEVKHVFYTYQEGSPTESHALQDICLNVDEGEFLGIVGHTGSGKSTLIQHLNGLLKPTKGDVLVDGLNINRKEAKGKLKELRMKVGIVFQYPEYQLFEETVDKSIWQTVGRTVNTSITTLLTVGMIFIFGVTSLRQFTLPMIIGIVAGAYSSMFLSGAFWSKYRGMLRKNRREKAQKKVSASKSPEKAEKPQLEKVEETPKAEEPVSEPATAPQAVTAKKVTPKKTSRKQRKKKH